MHSRKPIVALVAIALAGSGAAVAQLGRDGSQQLSLGGPSARPKTRPSPPRPRPIPAKGSQFGNPLDDLSAELMAVFAEGREEFEAVETAEGGLGPIFNDSSCAACHSSPVSGGASEKTVTRFGRTTDGKFDPMTEQGGPLLQAHAIDPAVRETVPAQATLVIQRLSTPLFGAGLVEAIPDAQIALNAERRKSAGITGRVAKVLDPDSGETRVGRFGWKAQHSSLLAFASDAYVNEMGVTSKLFPTENAPNGNVALLARFDRLGDPEDAPDPATGRGDIDKSTNFMRLLGPPPTLRPSADALQGRRAFESVGCADCHLPSMFTGPNPVPALANKRVDLFSDLLLHDMGALADGHAQGAAGPREMKTAPLWGLRVRTRFLHDGRAASVDEAIRAHDGEAAGVRDRYGALGVEDRRKLLEFLKTI